MMDWIANAFYLLIGLALAFTLGMHWERDRWQTGRREKLLQQMQERDAWLKKRD